MDVNGVSNVNADTSLRSAQKAAVKAAAENTDFLQVIMQLLSNSQENSQLLSSLTGSAKNNDGDVINGLSDLMAQFNSNSLLSGIQNSSGSATSDLLSSIMSGTNSTDAIMQLLGGSDSKLSADTLSALYSGLTSSAGSSSVLGGINGLTATETDDVLSTASLIPFEALQELDKISAKTDKLNDTYSTTENSENLTALKEAIANGDVTLKSSSNDAEKLLTDYKFASDVTEAKKQLDSVSTDAAAQYSGKVYDYSNMKAEDINTEGMTSDELEKATFTQTLDGLSKGIVEGSEKFSIKLNPEGLGEITVNLEKSADGLVVDMIVSNARTAEFLNKNLGSLQDNLSAYNTQVNQVVVSQSQASGEYQGFSQQFADGQYSGSGYSENQTGHNTYGYQDNNDDQTQQAVAATYSDGLMNTYI